MANGDRFPTQVKKLAGCSSRWGVGRYLPLKGPFPGHGKTRGGKARSGEKVPPETPRSPWQLVGRWLFCRRLLWHEAWEGWLVFFEGGQFVCSLPACSCRGRLGLGWRGPRWEASGAEGTWSQMGYGVAGTEEQAQGMGRRSLCLLALGLSLLGAGVSKLLAPVCPEQFRGGSRSPRATGKGRWCCPCPSLRKRICLCYGCPCMLLQARL